MGMTIEESERREERRDRQRAWRKENIIDLKNEFGITDPTPHIASKNLFPDIK